MDVPPSKTKQLPARFRPHIVFRWHPAERIRLWHVKNSNENKDLTWEEFQEANKEQFPSRSPAALSRAYDLADKTLRGEKTFACHPPRRAYTPNTPGQSPLDRKRRRNSFEDEDKGVASYDSDLITGEHRRLLEAFASSIPVESDAAYDVPSSESLPEEQVAQALDVLGLNFAQQKKSMMEMEMQQRAETMFLKQNLERVQQALEKVQQEREKYQQELAKMKIDLEQQEVYREENRILYGRLEKKVEEMSVSQNGDQVSMMARLEKMVERLDKAEEGQKKNEGRNRELEKKRTDEDTAKAQKLQIQTGALRQKRR